MGSPGGVARSVLVIEDDDRVRRVVSVTLRREGLEVTEAGSGGEGLAAVTVERSGPWVCLIDNADGPGLPEAERAVVFERFAGGSRSTRASSAGSGPGLALVSRHVLLTGGTVAVTDAPGGGARFVVRLPAAPAAEDLP